MKFWQTEDKDENGRSYLVLINLLGDDIAKKFAQANHLGDSDREFFKALVTQLP